MLLLYIRGEERHRLGDIKFYFVRGFGGGISLGKYILVDTEQETTVRHEYGHCIQSRILGWLYIPVICIPSLLWAWFYTGDNYYGFYTERWADKLMNIKRQAS